MTDRFWMACLFGLCACAQPARAEQPSTDENLLVLVADPHVSPGVVKRAKGFEADTREPFTNMVRAVAAMNPRPAGVLFLGDLVEQPTAEAYRLFRDLLAPLEAARIPYYLTLGNHDQAARFYEVFPEWKAKCGATGSLAYRIALPAVDVLTLETTDPANMGGYYGRIAPDVRAWLQAELRRTPTKPVFIAGHHDVDFGKYDPDLAKEANFQGWLNGHWHVYRQKTSPEGVRILWLPSLGFMDGGENPMTGYALLRAEGRDYRLTLLANPRSISIPVRGP